MADIRTEVAGNVWKIVTTVGQSVVAGDTLMIIESMKMEIPVEAPSAGTIVEFRVDEGQAVPEDAVVAVIR